MGLLPGTSWSKIVTRAAAASFTSHARQRAFGGFKMPRTKQVYSFSGKRRRKASSRISCAAAFLANSSSPLVWVVQTMHRLRQKRVRILFTHIPSR